MASPDPTFRISMLDTAEQRLRELARQAVGRGVAFEFARDLDALRARLRDHPARWGDQLFDYRVLAMTHYRGRSEFLYTFFSLHENARLVYVQDFSINPYSRIA
jgi:hypothetical protein